MNEIKTYEYWLDHFKKYTKEELRHACIMAVNGDVFPTLRTTALFHTYYSMMI